MKKLVLALAALALTAGAAQAERYVMITHGEGKDPFWPVVQKGGEDAARHVGADFEYIFNPSGDMGDMAKSITAAAEHSQMVLLCLCQIQTLLVRRSKMRLLPVFLLSQ